MANASRPALTAWRTRSAGAVEPSDWSVCVCRSIKNLLSLLRRLRVQVVHAEGPVDANAVHIHGEGDLPIPVEFNRAPVRRRAIVHVSGFEIEPAVLQLLRRSHGG